MHAAVLQFDQPAQTFHPKIDDTQVVALFTFANTGDRPVTISGVRSTCGCTATNLDKMDYAPGEHGEITAIFTFGDRSGEQDKIVHVFTDIPGETDIALHLNVFLPVAPQIVPGFLDWSVGDPLLPKTARVILDPGIPYRIVTAVANDERFSAEWISSSGEVRITPKDTRSVMLGMVNLKADNGRTFHVFVQVREAPSPPPASEPILQQDK